MKCKKLLVIVCKHLVTCKNKKDTKCLNLNKSFKIKIVPIL